MRDPRKAEQNQEMMDLYKQHGVNPMGGCLPMIPQFLILFAYYRVLNVAIEMRGAHWFWITDLSQPEKSWLHILPLLMVVTQVVLQKMTPNTSTDPTQQRMMMLMPLMMIFFFYSASSGLVLYWLTGNVVSLIQQWFFNRAFHISPAPALPRLSKTTPRSRGNKLVQSVSTKKYTVEGDGPKIEAFLGSILKDAGLELRYNVGKGTAVHADFENPEIAVKFSGPDVDLLLSNKAELMLALEQLTMEMLRMAPEDHSQIQFDANDYRMLRIEELRLSALTVAEKVKKSRIPFEFNPMNSRERRIVHLALRNEPAVRSESIGVGPNRQVVVYPAGMPSIPPSSRPPQPAFRKPPGRGRR